MITAAERVKKHQRKQNKMKKVVERNENRVRSEEKPMKEHLTFSFQPHELPAFFDLAIEKRHVDNLGNKTLNKENRLQVIYRILKDQLRIHKKQLLNIKKQKAADQRRALDFQRRMEKASAKKDTNSIANQIKEIINEDGS